MTVIYTNVAGLGFKVRDEGDTVREDLTAIEEHNLDTAVTGGVPIRWIEVTGVRPEEGGEDGGNGDGTMDVPLHIRVDTIIAVGD